MKKNHQTLTLYLLLFLYLEIVCKILMYNQLIDYRLIFIILFIIPLSIVVNVLSKLFNSKINKVITIIIVILITAFYIFNYMYYSLFSVPFSISTLELASQAMDFVGIGVHLVVTKIVEFLILLIPFIIYIINVDKFDYEKIYLKKFSINICIAIIIYIMSILSLNLDKKDLYSAYNLYYNLDSATASFNTLGIFTTERLDIKRFIFGFEEVLINKKENELLNLEDKVSYNKIDIDFDKLINSSDGEVKNAFEYLKNKEVTNKNDYTGMYKGKNLIFILAEGFNEIAVDKDRTPTLYKMIHEGFDFKNYYSPVFLSTTGGEFQAMTSLIPSQEILGYWRRNNLYFPYSLGNSFKDYKSRSFHNWSYRYYGRDKTMPSLGFYNYKACENGLEKNISCKWLPSDVDLINASFDDYKSDSPFLTYYITVSGHAPYNFDGGNSIALKNQEVVNNLSYSDSVKAYLSTQMELEYAISDLISKLDDAGILDDTVIVLTGDHYPYTLTLDEINEISSYKKDEIVEVNHSNLIIWNNNNEHIEIDKVASQVDVLPTILNLFGIDYDSRLLIGKDIFSNNEGIARFSDRSWVSDQGTYFTSSGFVPKEENFMDNNYVDNVNEKIVNDFLISKIITANDLYKKIFEEG